MMRFSLSTPPSPPPSPPPTTTSSLYLSLSSTAAAAMDPFDFTSSKSSPRRELQGPRPTPLKVRKDSHKIRKPPLAPPPQQQSQPPPRPPIIIYTVSPKVIHANPSEFMTLVQRLTGPSSYSDSAAAAACSSSSTYPPSPFHDIGGLISPAARFAAVERAMSPIAGGAKKTHTITHSSGEMGVVMEGIEVSTEVERTGVFPGILSPNPASLPPISPNFFSPASELNPLNFFHDLSPVLQGHKNSYIEGNFMPSPSFFSPYLTSPPPSLDLFNNFSDF